MDGEASSKICSDKKMLSAPHDGFKLTHGYLRIAEVEKISQGTVESR
jgi:hypothetical protein